MANNPRVQTVAVDFDGVIHTYERGWHDGTIYGELMPGAVDGLSRLLSRYAVFVHTTRNPYQVARWIEQRTGYGIECIPERSRWWPLTPSAPRTFWNVRDLLLVTNRKLPAVAYLDDRAVRFTDWPAALADLGGEPS